MKKLSILALAAILVVFFTIPASALENEFGGYWRTRFFKQRYFSGFDRGDRIQKDDPEPRAADDTVERVDTRTRLYYTAKINDNLKLVNKFEMDAQWGGQDSRSINSSKDTDSIYYNGDSDAADQPNKKYPTSYGDTGSDGIAIEVKNTYADFNLGPVNFTVGAQPYELFRGFAISDDASGVIARWKAMDKFVLAGSWLKNFEGGSGDGENEDVDTYTLTGAFFFSESISLKTSLSYARTDQLNGATAGLAYGGAPRQFVTTTDGANFNDDGGNILITPADEFDEAYFVSFGADFDMTFDKWGLWATAFGQWGEAEDLNEIIRDAATGAIIGTNDQDYDISTWLVAVGGDVSFGDVWIFGDTGIHSEFFYASGDDDVEDDDIEGVLNPNGSYYWSEIMGYGLFDNQASAGSPADKITNIWAINAGFTMQPLEKLKVTFDYWYAELAEDEQTVNDEDELGHEFNLKLTYELVEGLNLDVVGAWLAAEDATVSSGATEENEEDPYELGAQLSLSF